MSQLWKETIHSAGFNMLAQFGIKLIGAFLIIFLGFKAVSLLQRFLKKRQRHLMDQSAASFLESIINVGLKILVVITAAAFLGIPLTAVITVLGSAGLAIGLALQGSLSNFAGGMMILIFKPFEIGDYIKTQSEEGTVTSISIFYTSLVTIDHKRVVIPNGTISNTPIVNYTAEKLRRVDLEFSASYETPAEQVLSVMKQVLVSHPLILSQPAEPFCRLYRQEDSAVIYLMRAWCKTEDYWTVYFDMQEQMKKAFDENHISIPYPHIEIMKAPETK